jgi:hypothetical protein
MVKSAHSDEIIQITIKQLHINHYTANYIHCQDNFYNRNPRKLTQRKIQYTG